MAADDGEATALVAPMLQPEGERGQPPVAVEAVVAQREGEDEQPTMAADAAPPPQQQPKEEGEQPTMAAHAVVAPTPPPPEEKEEDEQPTMAADAVDAPMPPPPQQHPEEEGEQPTMAADPVVAPTPPPPPPPKEEEEDKVEDKQSTMAAEAVVVPVLPPPPQPEEEEEVGQPTMAADAVVVQIPPPQQQPEEKEEDEQPVPPAALPQPLESVPGPADKGDEETSQAKNLFKVPCPVDEGDKQIQEGNNPSKVSGPADEGDKETRRDKTPNQVLGPGDERDEEIWRHSLEDDYDDYWNRFHHRSMGVHNYSERLFHRSRYSMDCYPYYHDNPLHFANGYLDRNGYPGYRHGGYPFGPYDHGYRNQYRQMNPLQDKSVYAHTMCCSRNLICEKKDWPVGASLSNPDRWICFLNCILQCVVHTVPLVLKLLKHGHLGLCPSGSDEFCCYCSLRHHASEVIRLSGDVLYPRKFVKCLKLVFRDFEQGQHQDAHEFLRCLLDKLDDASVASRSSSEEPSIVKEIFGGQLKSQLHCPECNHCSDRLESFLDLNLEVNQMDTVMDSLRSFTKNEVVEDFVCDGCKSRVNMEKRLKVEQAPEVLVIQLKRFQNLGCNISKIHDMVKYELELDLNPFMSSPEDKPQNYDLYGVVEHLGDPYKGHYVCYVRSSETDWFLFNDDKVVKVNEDRLLDSKAYLLFYVKKGSSPWFSTLLERKDTLLSGYLQELLDEGLDENGLSIDGDEGSYSGSDSDEQDAKAHYFGGPAEKIESGPSSAGLSQRVQGNANGSTMFSVSEKNEVRCNLGGGPPGGTQKHTSLVRSSAKNGNSGGLELVLWNKESLSTQGSHGTREMNHSIHGGSSQENGRSCNLLQSSAHKHEDDCCPKNLTLHKENGMRGSCHSSAGSPRARKKIVTSRFRSVGPSSNRTTKGDVGKTGGRKRLKTWSAAGATKAKKQKMDASLKTRSAGAAKAKKQKTDTSLKTRSAGATKAKKQKADTSLKTRYAGATKAKKQKTDTSLKTRSTGATKAKKQKTDTSLKILPWKTRSEAAAWAARGRPKRKRR